MALGETGRCTWTDHGIQLTRGEHARKRFSLRCVLDDYIRRQLQNNFLQTPGLFIPATDPGDVRRFQTMVFFQEQSNPYVRCQLVLRHTDTFALEVCRGLDSAIIADIDRGVSKRAGREDGRSEEQTSELQSLMRR